MSGKAVLFPALFVVALAAMSPSLATVEAQSSELEVYAGYYVPQPSILDSTATFGLRGGYNLNRRIGLYGDFQWVKLDPIDLRYFFLDFVADVNFFPDNALKLEVPLRSYRSPRIADWVSAGFRARATPGTDAHF